MNIHRTLSIVAFAMFLAGAAWVSEARAIQSSKNQTLLPQKSRSLPDLILAASNKKCPTYKTRTACASNPKCRWSPGGSRCIRK